MSIRRVPRDYATIQSALDACEDGDTVVLAPIVHVVTEPLAVGGAVHVLGTDPTGARATVAFDAGDLRPWMPLMRVDGEKKKPALVKGVVFRYTHHRETSHKRNDPTTETNEPEGFGGDADPAVEVAAAIAVVGGAVTFDECAVESSAGGWRVTGGYATLRDVDVATERAGVVVSGSGRVAMRDGRWNRCAVGVLVLSGEAELDKCEFREGGDGVRALNGAFAKVSACVFGGSANGVVIEAPVAPTRSVEVTRCSFTHIRGAGIITRGAACAAILTRNSFSCIEAHRATGILVEGGGRQLSMASNTFERCTTAVHIGGGEALLESNDIQRCVYGVRVQGSRPTVRQNVFSHCDSALCIEPQIQIDGSEDPEAPTDPYVEVNTFSDNNTNVVMMRAGASLLQNDFGRTKSSNIVVEGASMNPATITGNHIRGAARGSAVSIRYGARCSALFNTVEDCQQFAFFLLGCAFARIYGNVVRSCQAAINAQDHAVGEAEANDFGDVDVTALVTPALTIKLTPYDPPN